ncbi:MAG: hypothetical protein HGB12_17060, partial [Bacteroidetes bacterium]|nr:hypothetical protein [Bacteroidota bacterium]
YICFGVDYSTSAPNHSGNLCGYNAGSWSALGGTDDGCFYVYGVAKLFQMLSQTGN